jgi:hypothetical protein
LHLKPGCARWICPGQYDPIARRIDTDFERELIASVLEQHHFNLTNDSRTIENQPPRLALSNATPQYQRIARSGGGLGSA